MVDGTVDLPGATIAYRRSGSGPAGAAPVVLVHGARMDGRVWDRVAPVLTSGQEVIVVDLRGRGRSTCDPDVPASFASDLRLLAGELGLSSIHLVGHSMGAGVALELAWQLARDSGPGRGPLRLATLGLVSPTPTAGWEPGPGVIAFSQQLAGEAAAGDREAAFETVLRYLWCADDRPRTGLDADAVARARTIFLDNLNPPWPAPLDEDHPAEMAAYARIETPTTIATGDSDLEDVQGAAATLASTLPHASHTRIAGAGHDLPNERPDQLAALLLAHIAAYGS